MTLVLVWLLNLKKPSDLPRNLTVIPPPKHTLAVPAAEQGDGELGLALAKDAQQGSLVGPQLLACCADGVVSQQLHSSLQPVHIVRLV